MHAGKPMVAVLGCGYWGKNLVRNFYELGSLRTVCDTDRNVLRAMREKYPGVQVTSDFDGLLADPAIDGVVIATPAATHYQLASRSMLNGKDVFVEKPIALAIDEASDLVRQSLQHQRILMVGHILHYHQAVLTLKGLIDEGQLGKIRYLYSNRLNIGKIRAEENILWSFAPHDISVILMLLGESPETVYATGGSYLQQHIPDTTLTSMDFPSGVKAHIFVSWLHPYKDQKLVVVGEKKMAVFDDVSSEKLLLYPHRIEWLQRIPVAAKAEAELVPIAMEEPLKAECRHFLECMETRATPRTDGNEGLRVLRVLDAAQESLNRNGCKVRLEDSAKQQADFDLKETVLGRPAGSQSGDQTMEKDYYLHESSYVDESARIGSGTKIWHFSHVMKGTRVGRSCSLGQNVVVGPDVTVGNGCKIQNNVSIYKGVTLEDYVFCGPSMVFTNVINPRCEIPRMDELRPTLVKRGASLGANCTVVCGTTIGRYAFVGAGAVVTRDVPDHALVVGAPAKVVGWVCECGLKLPGGNGATQCPCGKQYIKDENGVRHTDQDHPTLYTR